MNKHVTTLALQTKIKNNETKRVEAFLYKDKIIDNYNSF